MVALAGVYRTSERFRARVLYGADLSHADIGGWTPLHRAAARGDVAMLEYLLARGHDADAKTGRGESAWHVAAEHGRSEAASFLEAAGIATSEIEFPEIAGPYLGQTMPGAQPVLFAPGIVSGHYPPHSPPVLSPDLGTVYWASGRPPGGLVERMSMEGPGLTWTPPSPTDLKGEPSFSADGGRRFFIFSEQLWVQERTASGWADASSLGDAVNSKRPRSHHSVDSHGNLYFSDGQTLYYSELRGGEYQEAVGLAHHPGNDTLRGDSPCVAPAGDLILFAARRGLRGKELCVTFRRADGSWSDRIPLGETINAGRVNDSPHLTPAGNFIFFLSGGNGRPQGVYWVSATVLDALEREHLGIRPPSPEVTAPGGTAPRIDGIFGVDEWTDAATLRLGATKKILLKNDGRNLYVAIDAPGGDLYFHTDDLVRQIHASFALMSTTYRRDESGSWSSVSKTPIALHGLQNQPPEEIEAAFARHLETQGWAASLIPMGNPYQTEFVVSLEWLGVAGPGADAGRTATIRMATKHTGGPPHMRPTWPLGLVFDPALDFGGDLETLAFDVSAWGKIAIDLP